MRPALLLLMLALGGCAESADLLLHNGKVFLADAAFTVHEAIVIRDGTVLETGTDDLVDRYRATRTIDLEGRLVVPGFNDTHIHIFTNPARNIDFSDTRSIEEMKRLVRTKAEQLGAGEWITGRAWSEDQMVEQRRPLRWDLDEAAPDNPVILARAGGHSSVANSMALRLAGVDRNTPDPEGGVIERDATGELNGIIRERAGIVSRLVPRDTWEDLRPSLIENLQALFAKGITSIVVAGQTIDQYARWEDIYAEMGQELPRVAVQIRWAGRDAMATFGKSTGDGDEHLRVGAVKILVDGGFTGPAAYTLEPYKGQPEYRGKLNLTREELRTIINDAHDLGWQMGFHAIGDGAIVMTVEMFADALAAQPRDDHRHYLNHFTVMPPERTMRMMAEQGIMLSQQPNFTYTLEGRYVTNLDGARLQHNNPVGTPMRLGVFTALSSDILPIGPMEGLYAAVTRKGMSGTPYAFEDEAIDVAAAIQAYTRNAAYFTFEENSKGTLEPGMLADLVVLNTDITTSDPEDILRTEPDMTILGGRVVYERN